MTGEWEWRLREIIKNALNVEGKILPTHYSTQFIPVFQCLLQAEAFSLSVLWRHSKPDILAIEKN